MWRNTTAKQKSCGGNIVAIHNVIFEKNTKLNSQPAQYKKNKIDKDQFEKRNHKKKEKNHIGKYCSNPQTVQYLKKLVKIILKKKLKKKKSILKKREKTCEKKGTKAKKKNMWGKLRCFPHAF
jgi:hypothetical protein